MATGKRSTSSPPPRYVAAVRRAPFARALTYVRVLCPATQVAKVIQGEFSHALDDYVIVDCRFPYEYQGGHIRVRSRARM